MKKIICLMVISLFLYNLPEINAKTKEVKTSDIVKVFSSSSKEANMAENAFDGDPSTRWESEFNIDPSWIAVKLKKKRKIKTIRINWEFAAAAVYQIDISKDGKKWKKVKRIEDGQCDEKRLITFKKPVITRYLRILGESRAMGDCGYSIWEVDLNPLILEEKNKIKIIKAEASTVQMPDTQENIDFSANMAFDGNMETRWSSEFLDPQWIVIQLQKKTKIKAVKIKWENASAKNYKIEVSKNGSSWKEVANINDGKPGEERVIGFKPVKAKFVRVYGEDRNGEWGYSIWEIEVYK